MTVRELFSNITCIEIADSGFPVELTVARLLQEQFNIKEIRQVKSFDIQSIAPVFQIAVLGAQQRPDFKVPGEKEWVYCQLNQNGKGRLLASRPNLIYSGLCRLLDEYLNRSGDFLEKGWLIEAAFKWHRVNFDLMVSNYGRTVRKLDLEVYARELVRQGYSHWEVNSIAAPTALEEGVYDEVYPRFYTYAAALDQFVESRLNKGTYPIEYLEANLNKMKKMVRIGLKYGLTPGLQCFEPRSMPEKFFQRFPFLRGPRVDHPFRSLKPRFALTLVHPVAREHYFELMENLMQAVPQLGFIKIISNDSGAGFEFTKSLYVGANGGPYLIREWKPDREIAQAAASNAIRFLRLLREAATRTNPEFRVITHLEPFYSEREYFIQELDHIDIEGASFLGTGWMAEEAPYQHPHYPDVKEIVGTALHIQLDPRERSFADSLQTRHSICHLAYSHGFVHNSEPLLAVPIPWLTHEKLKSISQLEMCYLGHSGGIVPSTHSPWFINQEVLREFHLNPKMDIDEFIQRMAERWVGSDRAPDLILAWQKFETAYRHYPPVYLYSGFGHSWYKLWTRPIIPDIEQLSEEDRAYYENFMLTTPHNPTRVDFNRDVMFELMTPSYALKIVQRIDENVWPELNAAIQVLEDSIRALKPTENGYQVLVDQCDRMVAFKCWLQTLRNVAAWIGSVHSYLQTTDPTLKAHYRQLVRELVLDELENAQNLLRLWETTSTEFMLISEVGETNFIYGENFGAKVKRKIELMQGHENDEPFIDPDFMWRVPGYEPKRPLI